MKKNVVLMVSAVLNIVLTATLVIFVFPNQPKPDALPASVGRPSPEAGEGRRVEQALLHAGLSAGESKQLVEALYLQRATGPVAYEYWRPLPQRDASEKIAGLERSARVRASLLAEFGSAAQDDPAFVRTFRPYDREVPALSSAQQVRWQELNLERLKAPAATAMPARLTAGGPGSAAIAAFETAMDPQTRLEYQLRESVLAKMLSATPFDFTEKEFRAVFEVLAAARPDVVAGATASSLNEALSSEAARKSLVEALGTTRYQALLRSFDPSYNLLRRIAEVRGISRDNMDQAYSVLASAKLPEGDPLSAQPPKELDALLGAEAANVYRAFVFSRQAAARGGPPSPMPTGMQGRSMRVSPPVVLGN